MEKFNGQRNYTLTTQMYSVEEYADLMDLTLEEAQQECVGCINAILEDTTTGYYFRLTRKLYATHFLAVAEATTCATLAILEDYFTYLRNKGLA